MFYSEPYKTAVQLQRLIKEKAAEPSCKRGELSGLARAFVELETLKLRIRMKPAPKAIDVSKPTQHRRGTNATTPEASEV